MSSPHSIAELRQTGEFPPAGEESPQDELLRLRARVQELETGSPREVRAEALLSMLSHELRTPLQTLLLNLDLCLQGVEPPSDTMPPWLAEKLARQRRMVTRLKMLVDTFLDVGAISTGELRLQPEPVDLAVVVQDVVQRASDDLMWARCPIRLDLEPGLTGRWDRRQLDLAVSNLLSNALKYGSGFPIEILVRASGDQAIVRIRDHGPGISRLDQARIFDKFARLPTPTRMSGFGLGLWITRHLIAAAGGTITVESELGQGATFTVSLPR